MSIESQELSGWRKYGCLCSTCLNEELKGNVEASRRTDQTISALIQQHDIFHRQLMRCQSDTRGLREEDRHAGTIEALATRLTALEEAPRANLQDARTIEALAARVDLLQQRPCAETLSEAQIRRIVSEAAKPLELEIGRMREGLSGLQSLWDNRLNALSSSSESLEKRIVGIEKTVATMQDKQKKAIERLGNLEGAKRTGQDEVFRQLTELQQAVHGHAVQTLGVQKKCDALSAQLDAAGRLISELQARPSAETLRREFLLLQMRVAVVQDLVSSSLKGPKALQDEKNNTCPEWVKRFDEWICNQDSTICSCSEYQFKDHKPTNKEPEHIRAHIYEILFGKALASGTPVEKINYASLIQTACEEAHTRGCYYIFKYPSLQGYKHIPLAGGDEANMQRVVDHWNQRRLPNH